MLKVSSQAHLKDTTELNFTLGQSPIVTKPATPRQNMRVSNNNIMIQNAITPDPIAMKRGNLKKKP